jgi:hypothetical protein
MPQFHRMHFQLKWNTGMAGGVEGGDVQHTSTTREIKKHDVYFTSQHNTSLIHKSTGIRPGAFSFLPHSLWTDVSYSVAESCFPESGVPGDRVVWYTLDDVYPWRLEATGERVTAKAYRILHHLLCHK